MQLEMSNKQFRRLLDLVYIGNWVLNSTRGDERFQDYDQVESLLFAKAALEGAKAGLEATKNMKPKHGKAAGFAAKALGTEDQGATAGMLLVQGLRDGIVK